MKKVNITNCYCLFLTVMLMIVTMTSIKEQQLLHERCDGLENEINAIKNEAVSDCESYIQLHNRNN